MTTSRLPTATSLPSWIDELARSRRPNHTLPQPFYCEDRIFREDLARVFYRQWVLAGHVARIPEPGSYFLYTIGAESIIVVRDASGGINAFFNVCRHRGSQICRDEEGHGRRSLMCPYHAWNYSLDGSLLNAPAMPPDFCKSEHGLRPLHVRVFHGFIYLCFADEPPADDGAFEALEPFVQPLDLGRSRLAARMTWSIRANWKLVTENFAECYHCGPAHPEYTSVMSHARPGTTGQAKHEEAYDEEVREWTEQARLLGHVTGTTAPALKHVATRHPIGKGGLSQARDGRPAVTRLLGQYAVNDGGVTSFRIHPASYLIASPDYAIVVRFTPQTTLTTLQEILWLVHPDAREGVDYDPGELTWLWRVTTDQDKVIIEDNQRGVNSMGYVPGPYSKTEHSVDTFVRWYLQELTGQPADACSRT